jgi:hypothetical protein
MLGLSASVGGPTEVVLRLANIYIGEIPLVSKIGNIWCRTWLWTRELIDLDTAVFPMLAGLCAYLDTAFISARLPSC